MRPADSLARGTAVLIALTALSSCSAQADATWATYVPSSPGGDSALLVGTLQAHDGCVLLVADTGEEWVPVFREGYVSATREGLLIGDQRLTWGDAVELGGGEWSGPLAAGPEHPGVTIPPACEGRERGWLVSDGGA